MICSIYESFKRDRRTQRVLRPVLLAWDGYGLGRAENHFSEGAAGGHHGVDTLKRSDLDIEQVRAGLFDRLFERGCEFPGLVDGAALEAVSGGELSASGKASRATALRRSL